jgi:hypothetical protein
MGYRGLQQKLIIIKEKEMKIRFELNIKLFFYAI